MYFAICNVFQILCWCLATLSGLNGAGKSQCILGGHCHPVILWSYFCSTFLSARKKKKKLQVQVLHFEEKIISYFEQRKAKFQGTKFTSPDLKCSVLI